MGKQQGLSQGLLKGSMVVEPCRGRSHNQGHCHWGQGHCHRGPQGGHQGQVHQGQQGQVFQEGDSHLGKQQGLSQGLLKGSKVVEPGQGRSHQGQVYQGQQGQVIQEGGSQMGKQQELSQGLLKGSKVVEPSQGGSQVQGHCHWGQLG